MSKNVFTDYYKTNFWKGKESLSGPGSDYEQTKYLIPEISNLIKSLDIKTILDIPCGDFNWMKKIDLSNVKYTGGDIVEELINKNKKTYGSKNISFFVIDIVNNSLQKSDLVIVRDCFVHLPNNDVMKAINNIKDSGSKYLLTTNFTWESVMKNNYDIEVGQWRRLNLTQDPYNFKYPEKIIVEGNIQSNDRDKTMGLWKIKDLPYFGNIDG